jgi:hypothetical protein
MRYLSKYFNIKERNEGVQVWLTRKRNGKDIRERRQGDKVTKVYTRLSRCFPTGITGILIVFCGRYIL